MCSGGNADDGFVVLRERLRVAEGLMVNLLKWVLRVEVEDLRDKGELGPGEGFEDALAVAGG